MSEILYLIYRILAEENFPLTLSYFKEPQNMKVSISLRLCRAYYGSG
jgi:hypothetical protein